MPQRNYAMVITQAWLGVRIGELLALRVEDVDFLRREVQIVFQFAPGSRVRTDPKTPSSKRTIPLPQVVVNALAAHIATYDLDADGTIFTTRFKNPYSRSFYGTTVFHVAVEKAGLLKVRLRTHYATPMPVGYWKPGEPVMTVAERLGHENAKQVIETYGHMVVNDGRRTRHAIDGTWAHDTDQIRTTKITRASE